MDIKVTQLRMPQVEKSVWMLIVLAVTGPAALIASVATWSGGFPTELTLTAVVGVVVVAAGQYYVQQRDKQLLLARQALLESELINGQLREQQWREAIERQEMELELRDLELRLSKQELAFRNRELTTYTLHLVQKNNLLGALRQGIQEIAPDKQFAPPKIKRLLHLIDYSGNQDKDWEEFKLCFENVHQDFFEQLKTHYPSLSTNELRLCALIKLNLSVKEMASLLGISPESVKMARHRLRKKLGLRTDQNLSEFMLANTAIKFSPEAASLHE